MYNQAVIIANEESKDKKDRKESTAVALRLKPKSKLTFLYIDDATRKFQSSAL